MLVRGLDYYTRTAFEIVCKDMDSPQQNALVAGGRYDNLIAELGGQSVPAVGWAMGLERVLLTLEILNKNPANEEETGFYIASLGEIAFTEAFKVADRLRRSGFMVQSSGSAKSLKSQMREADRLKTKYTLILGGDELAKGIIMLRDMGSGAQKEIPLVSLENELKPLINSGHCEER
jgi:histidyl-tRNA synthetase